MGFAEIDEAEEDHVGFVMDTLKAEDVLDSKVVRILEPIPAERVVDFDDGEAGGLDAPGDAAISAASLSMNRVR